MPPSDLDDKGYSTAPSVLPCCDLHCDPALAARHRPEMELQRQGQQGFVDDARPWCRAGAQAQGEPHGSEGGR
eukprot:CAMPEP_0194310234 /NCGR_PEP_ID=MMETSP0171-20130528/7168_1 /TAXON_ID=218684 /ORGANISM="Corethron pennatum, Strain L29A3" /LENGTH=72 /DNA_ID=CAMNT_0039063751 /DNA_START=248 /DNA_END=466 /DNA_ORIENTATION=-